MYMRTVIGDGEDNEYERIVYADGHDYSTEGDRTPVQKKIESKDIKHYNTGAFFNGALFTYVTFHDTDEAVIQRDCLIRGSEEPQGSGMKPTGYRLANESDPIFNPYEITMVFNMDSYTPETMIKMGAALLAAEMSTEPVPAEEAGAQIYAFPEPQTDFPDIPAIAGGGA